MLGTVRAQDAEHRGGGAELLAEAQVRVGQEGRQQVQRRRQKRRGVEFAASAVAVHNNGAHAGLQDGALEDTQPLQKACVGRAAPQIDVLPVIDVAARLRVREGKCASTQVGALFQQGNRDTAVGQGAGGGKTSQTAANHHAAATPFRGT